MKRPIKILDLSKKAHRDQVISKHKSITSLEPPENDLLRVFKTHSIGFGVVAHKTIKKNEKICVYQGETVVQEIKNGVIPMYDEVATVLATKKKQLTQNEDKRLTETAQEEFDEDEDAHQLKKLIKSYAFLLKQNNKQRKTVLSHRHAGIAALVNCSWNGFANVEAILVDNQIVYRAIRDILPGEEILIDYGYDYIDSQEFLHIFPIGSRSIDLFLKQNAEHYPSPHQSITLDKTEQALLGTQATHVLVPHYCSDFKKLKSLSDTEINLLPVIEMVKSTIGDQFIPLPCQQFMTGLMYACLKPELRENQTLFDRLIKKEMCVDFVTENGRSAWQILTARYDNTRHINKMCMKLSTALYHLYDKRGWADAYLPYLRKNLKETSLENQEAIFSASLIPPKKTHSKRINLTQEDSQPKTNPSVVAETLITTEASPFDKSLILSETKLDDLQVSHSLSSIQHKDSYHFADEKIIVEARPEVISPQFSNEEKIQPKVTPYFTDDEKMREPSETKQAGFNAHMELDPGIEPRSKLKRSDSLPILEAVPSTENKFIILPIIKPRDYIALTTESNESKIEPKIEPKEEVKQSDISMIWWDAALAANNGDSIALNKLISAKENLMTINWNYTPLTGFYRGVTLALLAAKLYYDEKPDLVEILFDLPVETHNSLDWNACAVDESHPERGITFAWFAALLADRDNKKPGLLKILAESPSSVHCNLNWHATPQALNHINRGMTLAWLIVKLNYLGSSFGLMHPLARLSQTLTDINWNVGPLDPKNNCYGESLAYLIVQSLSHWQMHKEAHLMIQALITSSQHTRHEINWHASGRTKFTLAYHAIRMAMGHHNYRYLHLLNALLDSPITVFMQLDWNMGISPDCSIKASDPTIAAYAVSLALEGDSRLLEKLLALPQSIFDKLDWNSGAEPLATNAIRLGLKGNTKLLQKLLDSPVEILKTIEWNKNNLLVNILRDTPQFFHSDWVKKLIRPELITGCDLYIIDQFDARECKINGNAVILTHDHSAYFVMENQLIMRDSKPLTVNDFGIDIGPNSETKTTRPQKADMPSSKKIAIIKAATRKVGLNFPLLIWEDLLKTEFKNLIDKGMGKCDEALEVLAELPEQCLQILCENLFADKFSQGGTSYGYIKFLIAIKSEKWDRTSSSWYTTFTQHFPSTLAATYFGVAHTLTHPGIRKHYYSKVGKDSPFYSEAQKKLRELSPPQATPIEFPKPGNKRKSRDCIDLTNEPVVKKLTLESQGPHEVDCRNPAKFEEKYQDTHAFSMEQSKLDKEIKSSKKSEKSFENKYDDPSFLEAELKFGAMGRIIEKFNLSKTAFLKRLNTDNLKVAAYLVENNQADCLRAILKEIPSSEEKIAFINAPSNWQRQTALTFSLDRVTRRAKKATAVLMAILDEIPSERIVDLVSEPLKSGIYEGWTPVGLATMWDKSHSLYLILNVIPSTQMSAFFNTYQPGGEAKGLNLMAIAVKYNSLETLQLLIKYISKNQLLELIYKPQMEGSEVGLTTLDIAVESRTPNCKLILSTLLLKIAELNPSDLLRKPQSTQEFQGCSLLVIAIILNLFRVVTAIKNIQNIEQRIALITAPQAEGPYLGMTAISIAVKLWNLNLLCLMLEHLPLDYRLPILHYRALTGEEKGLSALDIAAKYKKSEGVAMLMSYLRLLVKMPQTVSIVQSQSVSFNFSSQVSMSVNTVTTSTSACLSVTQTTVEKTL